MAGRASHAAASTAASEGVGFQGFTACHANGIVIVIIVVIIVATLCTHHDNWRAARGR
jgi:hypothetical protein